MIPHEVLGHPNIEAAKGKVALMRGPIIYCLEEVDNPEYFNQSNELKIKLNELVSIYDEKLLGGVVTLKSKASTSADNTLVVTYVPYYSWANRGEGKMTVWAPYK